MAKEKILIVDDETDVLDLCRRILETQGYNVTSTSNGYDAIEFAQTQDFDLLLTDIKMPGISGLEIAQMLKEYDPNIICVTMTGFSTMDMAINALKLGVDEFILKPFTPKELGIAIAKALEKEQLRKENFRLNSLIPLFELNKILLGTVDVNEVLKRLLEIAQKETKASLAGLYIIEETEITPYYHCAANQSWTDKQKRVSRKLAEFIFENNEFLTLARTNENELHQEISTLSKASGGLSSINTTPSNTTLTVSQVSNQIPSNNTQLEILNEFEAESIIASPLKSNKAKLGALILAHKETVFAPSDNEFLSVLCSQASIALDNARLFTKIQEAYDQLKTLDHMKSEFINIAAHELRTPLAILMGYVSVLNEEIKGPYQEFVSNIMRNAMRLRSLIDDMLNLKYLESGRALLVQNEVNLLEAIQEITQDISLLAKKKQLDIKVDVPPNFPIMIIDRQKFDLIVVNLMHNAVKFTPAGGKITFSSDIHSDKAIMSLHNTDTTIPKEKIDRIFEQFFQIESSLTREHGGAGLGLAIVRGMIDVCGGEISVESTKEKGTTFTFSLPLDNTNIGTRQLTLKK